MVKYKTNVSVLQQTNIFQSDKCIPLNSIVTHDLVAYKNKMQFIMFLLTNTESVQVSDEISGARFAAVFQGLLHV